MTPFHYAIVQARDPSFGAERRNVGLVALSPATGKAWMYRGDLRSRAHLLGDDAAFVRALLDMLQEEAGEVAREGSAAAAHHWLRARSRPSEDTLVLAQPAMGITADLDAEMLRLRVRYLGKAPTPRKSAAETLRDRVLRDNGLQKTFGPREFESGPATWKFPCVADAGKNTVVFNALQFGQRKPEAVLDAAFHNIGRAGEVQAWYGEVQWVTVAAGPREGKTGEAFTRACALMSEAGLNIVPPEERPLTAALNKLNLRGNQHTHAEA